MPSRAARPYHRGIVDEHQQPNQAASDGALKGDFTRERHAMVERQLVARGIRNEALLAAFRRVPREAFVPAEMRQYAYDDAPVPIGLGQTISQPYIVARMIEALELEPGARVLEVGTGSGYAAAILAEIADTVYTVERHEALANRARADLDQAGYRSVHVIHGDGTLGYAPGAPYDGIVVAAGGPAVPEPLERQLAANGRLVIPVGRSRRAQELIRVTRMSEGDFRREHLDLVRFVPLVGQAGWKADSDSTRNR
jgi:protein-L-isoaspartate(D-aspartate) O-methyltransferase